MLFSSVLFAVMFRALGLMSSGVAIMVLLNSLSIHRRVIAAWEHAAFTSLHMSDLPSFAHAPLVPPLAPCFRSSLTHSHVGVTVMLTVANRLQYGGLRTAAASQVLVLGAEFPPLRHRRGLRGGDDQLVSDGVQHCQGQRRTKHAEIFPAEGSAEEPSPSSVVAGRSSTS